MKKFVTGIALLSVVALSSCSDDSEKIIGIDDIPPTASSFISTYYPSASVTSVTSEGKGMDTDYDVYFADGSKIEFNYDGEWKSVDAPFGATIPAGRAPEAIAQYVAANYHDSGINEISRDRRGYEVELLNGIDLEFAPDCSFIRVDK